MKIRHLLFVLVFSSFAFGQGSVVPPQTAFKVVNGITSPIANATITVCAAQTSGVPCSPVLSNALFLDAALTEPLENPFTADANGNYQFAIANGTYTVTVSAAGFAGYSYQITVGGGGGSSGGSGGAGSGPVFETIPNCPIGGTVTNGPVQLSVGTINGVQAACVVATPIGSTSAIGICNSGCGTTGNASVAYQGFQPCVFTGQTVIGDVSATSTSAANQCDDVGATRIPGVQSLGRISSVNTGAGTLATVNLFTGDVVGAGASGGNGTVNNGPQNAMPEYVNPGNSNQIGADPNCTVNSGNIAGCNSVSVGQPGTLGAITVGNNPSATLPAAPASGTSKYFTDINGNFLCINGSGTSCAGTTIDVRVGYGGSGGVDCSGAMDSTSILQTMINNAPDFTKFVFPVNCKVLVSTTGGAPTAITIQSRYGLEFWFEGHNTNACDTGAVGPGGAAIIDNSSYVSGAKIFYINQSQRLLFHNLVMRLNGAVDIGFDVDQTTNPPITTQNIWENTCIQNNAAPNSSFKGWRFSNTSVNNVEAQWLFQPYVVCSSGSASSGTSNGYGVWFGNNANQKDDIVDRLATANCSADENIQFGSDFTGRDWLMSNSWFNLQDGGFDTYLAGMRSENAHNAISVTNSIGPHTYLHNDFAAGVSAPINCNISSFSGGCGSIALFGSETDTAKDWFAVDQGNNDQGQNSSLFAFNNRNFQAVSTDFGEGSFICPGLLSGTSGTNNGYYMNCMTSWGLYLTPPRSSTAASQNFASPAIFLEGLYNSGNTSEVYAIDNVISGTFNSVTASTLELAPFSGGSNGRTSSTLAHWLAFPGSLSGITLAPIANPSAPSVAPAGTPGSTNYSYKIVAHGNNGTTAVSSAGSCSTCAATLNSSNYNTIQWPAVAGATSYDVYRTVCGSGAGVCLSNPTGKIATYPASDFLNAAPGIWNFVASIIPGIDQGAIADGSTPPGTNNTGYLNGTELPTPSSNPAAGTEQGYFKAGSGWCSFDSTGTERCSGGASGPVGPAFYASTNCTGVANCVTLVDDDSTNNCGTALTNWITAINAYAGNGQAYVTFQMSGSGKAFLFSTCSMSFTNPVVIQANATFDAGTNSSANLINFGLAATCTTTSNCGAFRWNGGTFLGGASLTNGIFEMKANINDFRLSGMSFLNVGTGNATLGSCTNYAILIDNPVANGKVQDTKYLRTDATTGWCAYGNPGGAAGGTNTIEFMNNTIGSGSGCGSVAIWDGGSLGNVMGGTIFGAAIPVRLTGLGHRVTNIELDANSCIAHAVQAPIQWGGPSAFNIRGISITDVTYQSEAGNTGFFQKAGDDAGSTIGGISLIGNKQVGRSGGSQALLGPSSASCSTASLLNSTDFCYASGNWGVQMPSNCVATSTNVNWMFNNQLADCLFNVTSAANETPQILFTSNTSNAGQNYLTYVNCQVLLYQAATTSSTLPQCQVTWTDNKTSVVQTSTVTPVWSSGTVGCSGTTTNTVGNLCTGTIGPINPKVGTSVSVQTINYTSTGATSMFYQLIGTAYVVY